MADTPRPFNSRGQILSKGGERYGAYMLRRGMLAFDLFKALDKKFGPVTDETSADVIAMAKAGLTSGRLLSASERKGALNPDLIPINEYLFGGDSGKGRAYIGASLGLPGEPPVRDLAIILPSELAWADINEAAIQQLTTYGLVYPGDTEWNKLLQTQELVTNIWFAERMF